MSDIAHEAKARGLTAEKLQELLDDE